MGRTIWVVASIILIFGLVGYYNSAEEVKYRLTVRTYIDNNKYEQKIEIDPNAIVNIMQGKKVITRKRVNESGVAVFYLSEGNYTVYTFTHNAIYRYNDTVVCLNSDKTVKTVAYALYQRDI